LKRRVHIALFLAAALVAPAPNAAAAAPDLPSLVDPLVGTQSGGPDFDIGGGIGATFPGAVVPFGMVQFSPDTSPGRDNFAGGYSYGDRQVHGFGLTHFSGAGCAVMQDLPILPTTTRVDRSPALAGSSDIDPHYIAAFDHSHERAAPGSYSVTLDPGSSNPIGVDLTATTRTGLMRLRFPRSTKASVLFNSGGSARANGKARAWVDPRRRTVDGIAENGRFCHETNSYRVYFSARFDRGFSSYGTWRRQDLRRRSRRASDESALPANVSRALDGAPVARAGDPSTTAEAGGYATFDTRRDRTVEVRVGVSFTSLTQARRNLRAEASRGSFDSIRNRARSAWNGALGRLTVAGGTRTNLGLFETALYHSLLHPNVVSDADGSYRGMDGRRHRSAGRPRYGNFSGWDVYRGQQQLVAMLFPGRAADMAQSLVSAAQQSGCLPRWSVVNGQTAVMVGDPSDNVIASAYAFGARSFDTGGALAAMLRGATQRCYSRNGDYTERERLSDYLRQGYVGYEHNVGASLHTSDHDLAWGSAATTLEYAVADFAISRFAAALGDRATESKFLARSGNWRTQFNPSTVGIEPRNSNGTWVPGYKDTSGKGFVEGDGAQYTWFVPQDPRGLFGAIGGADAAAVRLDRFFSRLNGGPRSAFACLSNEPSLGIPWLYDWLGRPYRTQAVVRSALTSLYRLAPGGLPGNDDAGAMSAWWVLGAIGLYPPVPGEDVLAVGSPLFQHTTIRTWRGTVTIDAPAASTDHPYVHSMSIGGRAWTRPWLRWSQIRRGAAIGFDLSGQPDMAWGAAPADAPPSFAP
jgi:predicted alpha-1,2-mannosidase